MTMASDEDTRKITRRKLVIVGDGECGKTCLLITFTTDVFPEEYAPTVFDTYVAEVLVKKKTVQLALWDTAGQEDYDRLRPLSYPEANIVLVCYAVDNPDSFHNIKHRWMPELDIYCPDIPIILVATKTDQRKNETILKRLAKRKEKPITTEQGETLAEAIHAHGYYECSSKTKEGVADLFIKATLASLKKKRTRPGCKSRKFPRNCQIL